MTKSSMPTNEADATGVSPKVELAVVGLVRFLAKYFKTHWFLFRHPASFGRQVIAGGSAMESHVAPFTYLTFGGFVFTIAISAIPYGAWVAFQDGIWGFEEIVSALQERWKEALSISTLLLASFPVLLTVSLMSSIYARIFYPRELRDAIKDLSAYAFGFAAFFYFLVYIIAAFGFLLGHFGVDTSNIEESDAYWLIAIGGMLVVPFVSIASPLLFLVLGVRSLGRPPTRTFLLRALHAPPYFLLVFLAFSLTASIPGAFIASQRAKLPSESVVARFVDVPTLNLLRDWQVTNAGVLTYSVLLENRTEKVFAEEVSGMWATLTFAKSNPQILIRHPEVELSTGRVQKVVIVETGSAELLRFSVPVKFDSEFRLSLDRMLRSRESSGRPVQGDPSARPTTLVLYFDPDMSSGDDKVDEQVMLNVEE